MKVETTPDGLIVRLNSEDETRALGQALASEATPGTVIALTGPLGAGKTRLARAIAEALGADPQAIASPTFVLIHEYEASLPVYHFDTYRLLAPEEFEELGAAEYFDAGGVCLVEWADRVRSSLPDDAWWVALSIEPDGDGPSTARAACLTFPAPTGPARASRLRARLTGE
jgi:tRNA threonylcarbamoyladenosine biosynthesis protein TsaE